MFKNAKEMALALASSENEFTDDDGNRYKCFADGDEYSHSPFRVFRNNKWEGIESFWCRYAQMKQATSLPSLPIDTKVLVSSDNSEWEEAHFAEFGIDNGKDYIECFYDGKTSHTTSDGGTQAYKYWIVVAGKFKGKKNF